MKNTAAWIVTGLVFSIAGCSGSGTGAEPNDKAPASAATRATSRATLQPMDDALLAGARAVGACALDQIDGAQVEGPAHLKRGSSARVVGWSSDEKKTTRDHVMFLLAGQHSFGAVISTGQPRPDVAKSLDGPSLANAGFSTTIDFAGVPSGDYVVKILVQESGDSQLCSTEKHLIVD